MMERRILEQLRHPALQGRWVASVANFAPEELIVEQIGPNFSMRTGATQRFYGGRTMEFVDFAHTDQVPVTFYETHTFDMASFFYEWNQLKFDPEFGVYGLPSDYMKDITINLFPVTSSTKPAAILTLEKAWPVDNQPFDLTYTNAEGRIVHQVNFSVRRPVFKKL